MMTMRRLLTACLLSTAMLLTTWQASAQAPLVISEFMAENTRTLQDEDGHYSDWIEIYNPTTNTVNLLNWCLTDNPADLTQWRFPSVNLAPYSYLVVFASGKNRAVAGAPLHTNFRLASGGEYLALVMPDGTNVASAFAPRYPALAPDQTYGFAQITAPSTLLVSTGMAARVLVPTSDIGLSWTGPGFDDSAWLGANLGVGFDGSTNYQSAIWTDIRAPMSNVNASAYIRIPFQVADPSTVQDLRLNMRFDDGFVAYLNGTEVARSNAPASPLWDSAATRGHGSEPGQTATLVADFDANTASYTPSTQGAAPGPNVQNANAGSTGRFLRLNTDGVNNNVNSIAFDRVAAGVFPMITAQFDFRVASAGDPADGFCFLLLPTSTYGNSGIGINPIMQSGGWAEEPNYPNVFAIGFDVYPHSSQNDVSVHWNGQEYVNVTIPRTTIDLVASVFHRCAATIEYVQGGAYVTVVITPNINGAAGAPFTAVNRLFIPMPQYESRVQIAGRTGGLDMNVDLDNIVVEYLYPSGLVAPDQFNLTSLIPLLQPGQNVLAIHGLNTSPNNADFLIAPELVSRQVTLLTTGAVYLATPTPGVINQPGEAFLADKPSFSVPGGVYGSNLVVELSSPLPGAVIRYTLDGAAPTESSPVYVGPISITNCVMLAARVYAPGYMPSRPASQTYTLIEPGVASFNSRLPIVIVNAYGKVLFQDMEPRITAGLTVIDTPAPGGVASPFGRPDYHGRAGIEGRGQTSWGFAKRPMNVEIRDDEDTDRSVSLLGMPAESDWILANPYNDKTFLNDFLAYELFEQMGHYSVRRRFVEVFYNAGAGTANWTGTGGSTDTTGKVGTNDYVGIYLLLERIKVDPNRVNITTLQAGENAEPEISGGYIWKKDKASPNDVTFSTSSGQELRYHDPKPQDLTPAQRNWLRNYLNQFEAALYAPNWLTATGTNHYSYYMDTDSFVDQHWIVEFTKQIDGYRLSNYMHKDRNGKIKMAPIWDWNLSFGNAYYLQGGTTNGWYWTLESEGITQNEHIWLRRLITGTSSAQGTAGDPDFRQRITDRWGELRTTVFNLDRVLDRVDQLTNYIWEAQVRDYARWPRINVEQWPNPNGTGRNGTAPPAEGWHVNYATPPTYSALIGDMKKWITGRFNWIDSQFLKAPVASRSSGLPGSPISLFAPAGAVYYTLDGSDPRLPGGRISPNAQLYSGPINLPAAARLFARAYLPGTNYMTPWTPWSPPVQMNFGDPAPSLAITELMYNPQEGSESLEFIELMNTGTAALDLTGVHFAEGIGFTFPPGPLSPTGSVTTNGFDGGGTAYTAATLGSGAGPAVTGGGPAGSYLRLASQGTGTNRNRIAFDQTATGRYDHLRAQFDFRGVNASVPQTAGTPTVQDFDTAGGTIYWLRNFDAADLNTPQLMSGGPSGNYVRLTTQVGSESGALVLDATEDTAYNTVSVNFDFRCQGAADGFGFAFLNVANFGATGTNTSIVAFSEEPNLTASLGVGFDIYNNNVPPLEPNANHVSLHWNGAQVANGVFTPALSLAAGVFHRAQVTFKFEANRVLVSVRIAPDVYGAGGAVETLFNNFAITNVTAYRGRIAFAGRTGGAFASQDIDNVRVIYLNSELTQPGGVSVQLLPVSKYGTSGSGTGLTDYLDEPAVSNVFAVSLDMHVMNPAVNDAVLYWNGARIASAYVAPALADLDGGVFHRALLDITAGSEDSLVSLSIIPDVFGTPGAPVIVFSNKVVRGFVPGEARVEVAGRSGGQDLQVDVDGVAVAYERLEPNLLGAGQRVLLVRDRAAFEARYGFGLPIAGQFSGSLDNGGERLLLLGRYGEPILDFRYSDAWYDLTDGLGFSLVSRDPLAPGSRWSEASQWGTGAMAGGSPGIAEPVLPPMPKVVVNEVLAHSDTNLAPGVMDAIELHNLSEAPADISHWYLSDDFGNPRKYRVPEATVIPPGGFVVFYETNFNDPALGVNRFGLRAEGDDIYLFSANPAGDLTGYYHGFDFGASEANSTLGRYVDSTGDDQFVAQTTPTLGTTNAGPKVGPVVITEVMYHPPDDAEAVDNDWAEYVELRNISGAAVDLTDSLHPQNGWRLRDAVDFEFPPGASIPAGGYILVVNFDPAWDTGTAAAFRARYGLGLDVPLYGPYGGKLDNSSDRVELTRPGEPDPDTGEAPAVLVDKVKYADQAPWPLTADGTGFSLHRVNGAAFGNDPANWAAGAPTPGGGFSAGTLPVIQAQPGSQVVQIGSTATFSVAASGPGALRYQWQFDGRNLFGATNATLVLNSVTYDQAGAYRVVVMSSNGATVSESAELVVYQPLQIIRPPQSAMVFPLTNHTFDVLVFGNGAVSYQWKSNGVALAGATNTSFTISNTEPTHDADYSVEVTDAFGAVTSVPAHLTVLTGPLFTLHPASVTAEPGSSVTNRVLATSTTPVRYQWLFMGEPIQGETNTTLILSNVQLAQNGPYTVLATDAYGSSTSAVGFLTVRIRPTLTVHPTPAFQAIPAGGTATITAEAAGAWPFYYRWRTNNSGQAILVGPSPMVLTLTNQSLANAAYYDVIVTNLASTVQLVSSRAYVTVVEGPTNQTVQPGANTTIRAVVGMPPVAFTNRFWWVFNGTNVLVTGTNISSTSVRRFTNDLVLTNITADRVGVYSLLVSNTLRVTNLVSTNMVAFGAAFNATLAFAAADTDGDGMPDEWEIANGLNPNDPSDASTDLDTDGMSNGAEHIAGTDPRDPQSYLKILLDGVSGAEAVLQFNALAGKSYSVLSRDSVTNSVWNKVADVEASGTDRVIRVTNVVTSAEARFYRLSTPKIP